MTAEAQELTDDQRISAAMIILCDARKALSTLYYACAENDEAQSECMRLSKELETAHDYLADIPERAEITVFPAETALEQP